VKGDGCESFFRFAGEGQCARSCLITKQPNVRRLAEESKINNDWLTMALEWESMAKLADNLVALDTITDTIKCEIDDTADQRAAALTIPGSIEGCFRR
jgi:hypothetical protein